MTAWPRVLSAAATAAVATAAVLGAAGCDAKATASDPHGSTRADQKSLEYESCAATSDCADKLRCLSLTCRRTSRSSVGDYYAALGAASRARRDHDAAIAAYTQALGQYGAEKLEVPPDIDCDYGATLADARAKRENAELAARVLHRCVLAVPIGSALRDQAFAHLADLGELGLDPLALAGAKTMDLYLTKAPQRPSSDKLTVSATANPATGSKSYALVSAKLVDPELKPSLVACWDAFSAAASKDSLAVTLPIKVAYAQSEYEDEAGTWSARLEPAAGLSGPDAVADACVRAVVEPALKGLKYIDTFTTKVTVTIK